MIQTTQGLKEPDNSQNWWFGAAGLKLDHVNTMKKEQQIMQTTLFYHLNLQLNKY